METCTSRLISIKQAAQILGISTFFLYNARATNREPFSSLFVSLGRRVLVDRPALNALLDRLKVAQREGT